MLEPWELILHHSYSGTPGVVFDHSPGHASHGRGVDLLPGDFVRDGQFAGSGAVRARRRGRVSVTPTANWGHLPALSVEIVFRREDANGNGHLMNADGSFFVGLFNDGQLDLGVMTKWYTPGSHVGMLRHSLTLSDHGVDQMSWVRAGYVYDGVSTVRAYLNGELVKTWDQRALGPVRPVTLLTIGSDKGGGLPFGGLIDDVKIWRPNPNRITHDFLVRILDGGVTDCWRGWGKAFRDGLNGLNADDVECADSLFQMVSASQAAVAACVTHSAATRQAWDRALTEYQRLWALGDVSAIGPVLAALVETLRAEGVPLDQVAVIRELFESRCFGGLLDRIPALDCDPGFVQMLSGEGN